METLFENSYVRDKKFAKEVYRFMYFRYPVNFVIHIIMILSFVCQLYLHIEDPYLSNAGYLLIVPVYFLMVVLRYKVSVKTMLKRDIELHGSEMSVRMTVTDACIQSTFSNGSVNTMKYDNIKVVRKTKYLILVQSKAKLVHSFQRDAFSVGTEDAFLAFLKDKGVKVK